MLHQITERSINIRILEKSPETILACGNILDQVHNIAIEMEVDIDSGKIISVEAQMVKVPFPECKPALENIAKLVGLRFGPGITQQIAEIVGGNTGCIHLSEVAVETVRLAGNTIFGIKHGGKAWREGKMTDKEFWGRVRPSLKDTCIIRNETENDAEGE